MRIHGNLHWKDEVVIRIAENIGAPGSVVAINNLHTGTAWLLATTATLEDCELIDVDAEPRIYSREIRKNAQA